MKKIKIFVPIIILILIIGSIVYFALTKDLKTTIMLSEINDFIERNPSDLVLGETTTKREAIKKAEEIFIERYGENIKEKKPYRVQFFDEIQAWLVYGTIPRNVNGGVPYILFQKSDGKVLAVWHDR